MKAVAGPPGQKGIMFTTFIRTGLSLKLGTVRNIRPLHLILDQGPGDPLGYSPRRLLVASGFFVPPDDPETFDEIGLRDLFGLYAMAGLFSAI
jgi:hypothetical protein